jgi:spore maturation protein CgeB
MPSGVNQRVFDIPLCGGFVISDPQEDLGELFADDEVVTYSSVEHLKELVTRYTANEKERLVISERAMKRIKGEHTYYHRVKKF